MPIEKDSKNLYIHKGNLPASVINGLASFIETGSTEKEIQLPNDYSDSKYPPHSKNEEVKGSIISLSGNCTRNNDHLLFNKDQYVSLNIYPNVEPFNKWNSFRIKTLGANNSVTLQMFNIDNELLFEETKSSLGNSADGWFIEWDLSNLNIGLEELNFKLIANTNNMAIENIFFNYDLTPNENESLFNNVKKEIFDNIDKIQIESYTNGFRVKKDGVYVYSICGGYVGITGVTAGGYKSATVNFPFTFDIIESCVASMLGVNPNLANAGTNATTNKSVEITCSRSSAGDVGVRWIVIGK